MLPALTDSRFTSVIRLFRHACPADQDAAPFLVSEGLRGIEVKAVIQLTEVCGNADIVLLIFQRKVVADKITGLIQILVPLRLRFKPLGTAQKETFSFQFKKIRALPHVTEGFAGGHFFLQGPFPFICGRIDHHGSMIVCAPSAQDHIISAVFFPYFGVPHMTGVGCGIICVGKQQLFFFKGFSIAAFSIQHICSSASRNIIKIPFFFYISRIKQFQKTVFNERTAGIDAVLIPLCIGT